MIVITSVYFDLVTHQTLDVVDIYGNPGKNKQIYKKWTHKAIFQLKWVYQPSLFFSWKKTEIYNLRHTKTYSPSLNWTSGETPSDKIK